MRDCAGRDACVDRERGKPSSARQEMRIPDPQLQPAAPAPGSGGRSQWSARRNQMQDKGFTTVPQTAAPPQVQAAPMSFKSGDRVKVKRAFRR